MVGIFVWFFFPFFSSFLFAVIFLFFVRVDFCFIFYKTLALKDSNTIQTAPPIPTPGPQSTWESPWLFFLLWLFSFVPSPASGAEGRWSAGAGGT